MNCKPGDLAVIVRPWASTKDIGRPVTVIRPMSPGEYAVTRNGRKTLASGDFGPIWLCDAHTPEFPCAIADDCLRPIRGLPDHQEDAIPASLPMLAPECERVV